MHKLYFNKVACTPPAERNCVPMVGNHCQAGGKGEEGKEAEACHRNGHRLAQTRAHIGSLLPPPHKNVRKNFRLFQRRDNSPLISVCPFSDWTKRRRRRRTVSVGLIFLIWNKKKSKFDSGNF